MNELDKERDEEQKALTTVIGFFVLAIFVGLSVSTVLSNDNNYFLKMFENDKSYIPLDIICISFIVLHHVRLWFGINYIQFDSSFGNAIQAATRGNVDEISTIRKKEFRLRLLLFVTSALFLIILQGNMFGIWGLAGLMIAQSCILVKYNILFFDIMYKQDKQKAANIFIGVGDFVVVVFTAALTFYVVLYDQVPTTSAYSISVLTIALGALIAVFIGETISQYAPAFLQLLRKLVKAAL